MLHYSMTSTITFHNKKPFGSIFKTKRDVVTWVDKLNKREVKQLTTLVDYVKDAIQLKDLNSALEVDTKKRKK